MQKNKVKNLISKTRQDYELIANHFSQTRVKPWPEMLEFKKYVQSNDKILDLGCGNGRLIQVFTDLNIDYTGIDISANLIKLARVNYPASNYKFLVGDMTQSLPLEDKKFDAVFCIAAFQHIPDVDLRQQVLKEIKRIIKPGGYLIMTNWNLRKWNLIFKYKLWHLLLNFKSKNLEKGDTLIPWKLQNKIIQRYYHAFTLKELERLFKYTSWQIIKQYKIKDNLISIIRA
ncbi:MAG: class I SAM-dependent methyltransferase [Patescibacteria group bacterium]|jgi:ubiquinone/menaquinone biosynthesis C-methylase UbiE|nr:class I SAM-dependent methyltransferase [Patescibacteria group bacterium]